MIRKLIFVLALALALPCFATQFAIAPSGEPVEPPAMDSSQPDTIMYDSGGFYFMYNATNTWGKVRFTSPSDFELRCIYIQQFNPNAMQGGIEVYVYDDNNGQPGTLISGPYMFSGPLFIGNAWLDVELDQPYPQLTAAEDFHVVFGPAPGGTQQEGWFIYIDSNGNTENRTSISDFQTGPWSTDLPGDLIVRAGGAVADFVDLKVNNVYNNLQKFFLATDEAVIYQAEVENVGTLNVNNYRLVWEVEDEGGTVVFSDSANFGALAAGGVASQDCPTAWSPATAGYYTARTTVRNQDDILLENNVAVLEQGVGGQNFGWFRYDDGETNGSISGAAGSGWGQRFDPPVFPVKVDSILVGVQEDVTSCDVRVVNFTSSGIVELWAYTGALATGLNFIEVTQDVEVFEGGIGVSYIYQTSSIYKDGTPPLAGPNPNMPTTSYDVTGTIWADNEDGDWMLGAFCSEGTGTPPAPLIRVEPDTVDFGTVLLNTPSQGQIVVYNDGDAILEITDIEPSTGIANDLFIFQTAFNVNPGSSHTVLMSWTPTTAGPMLESLTITNNDTTNNPYVEPLQGIAQGDGVVQTQGPIPAEFALEGAYPNPFNNSTTFAFSLPSSQQVTLKVYDVHGQEVAELTNGWMNAGRYEVSFNASDLASGVYLYRLQAGEYSAAGKMVFLK